MNVILGSASPRRKALLEMMGVAFKQHSIPIEEKFVPNLPPSQQAENLAIQKMNAFYPIHHHALIITADTVVVCKDAVLAKPNGTTEALEMLQMLNGTEHIVYTAVCLADAHKQISFTDHAIVKFAKLSKQELQEYIIKHQPYDKAGAYGVQDWMGACGIEYIKGSFYTVMGLPTHLLYQQLKKWPSFS